MDRNGKYSESNIERHLNSYIHSVINLLRDTDGPLSFEEIRKCLSIDLYKNHLLLNSIKKNPRIHSNGNKLQFKPLYDIRNIQDLKNLLVGLHNEEGVEWDKLVDSPVRVTDFINKMKEDGEAILLKDNDGSEVVFYNQVVVEQADEEIRALWETIKIPQYQDLIEELNTVGLKKEKVETLKRKAVIKKAKTKRSRRNIKLTNTHVKGLDLSGLD